MADIGHRQTDEVLERLEKRLAEEYAQAYKDVEKKAADYFKRFEVKDKQKKALVDAGKLTEKEYQTWRRNQMLSGKRWTDLRDQLAKDLTNTNQIAAGIVRGELNEVFAINANYSEYMIENGMRTNYGFTLYSRESISNLVANDPDIIPWKPVVDIPADLRWNRQMITSHITQGILQGESIPHLSKRLLKTVNNDKVAAVRTARTAVTSSQNAGRQMVYDRAKKMGLKLKKSWVATLDARTRHEHGAVDGQEVPLDGEFIVDGYKMKYPGDMSAPGYLVYSCRCTTITVEPDYITKGEEPRMTYSEWVESKEGKDAIQKKKDAEKKAREKEKEKRNKQREKQETKQEKTTKVKNIKKDSFAEQLSAQELSPYYGDYSSYEEFYKAKKDFMASGGKGSDFVDDVFRGKYDVETLWTETDERRIAARLEHTLAELEKRYPARASGVLQYGETTEKIRFCDYDSAYIYLPDGRSDRRLHETVAAQVFENGNQTVIAFNRDQLFETMDKVLEDRKKSLFNGEVLLDVTGASPEFIAIHEWGHVMSKHITNAMINDEKTAQDYFAWYRSLSKEEIRAGLSVYATTNRGEFEAECFAEMLMPNPRPLALKFKEFLDKCIELGY